MGKTQAELAMAKKPADDRSDPIVLFVDDDPDTLELYGSMLEDAPVRVMTAPSGLHALQILQVHSAEIAEVVSDYEMAGMNGIDLLDTIARRYPHIERVLLTGIVDSDIIMEAKQHKVLAKGFDGELIKRAILRRAKTVRGGSDGA